MDKLMVWRKFKYKKSIQEVLSIIKEKILKDASSGEKGIAELAKIYGISYETLRKYYRVNGIKKKREYVNRYGRGCYKKRIEELRDYIKENNITKEEILSTILSI